MKNELLAECNPQPGVLTIRGVLSAEDIRQYSRALQTLFGEEPKVTLTGVFAVADGRGFIPLQDARLVRTSRRYVSVEVVEGLETQVDPIDSPSEMDSTRFVFSIPTE